MGTANRNISLRAIRIFCVAAERESFREAAELLFLTSSAVSHQIKQLEIDLGNKLFERTPRALHLTAEGTALYEDISPFIADFDSVITRHKKTTQSPTLRISVQPFFASELFVPRLPEFVEQHPDIDISIDTRDESPEKHPRTSDVSIRIFRSPPDSFAYERLFPLRLLPAGTPDLYDAIKVRSGRINGPFPLVIHESRPKAWRDWERSSRLKLPDHANAIRLDSMIAAARAAERGLGAALVPKQLSDAWLESSRLVQLFDHELLTRDAYYLVCRKEDREREEIRLFREWVVQNFADRG